MAYLEELLPEFRKGVKIRCSNWGKDKYIQKKGGLVATENDFLCNLSVSDIFSNRWEQYQEPELDWQYIIDNKCLCWFWNGDDRNNGVIDYLVTISNDSYESYENTSGCRWSHCHPVRKDEVTFYEDKKDEEA